ncbi:DUF4190 domain-containing protein [Ammonicoccus fulvus]|uniref:DUF4190 domain-containing protein n=1 Tax=Ammonicoccus fulvus TaxID=3138240 RepID=A0ABZ3FN82_9ACTN
MSSPYQGPQDPYRPDPSGPAGFPTYPPPPSAYAPPPGAAPMQPYSYGSPYASQSTNTLAIIALVTSFFVPIAGIICGHLSLGQIRRTGENGRGLALAGLIIGYAYTAFIVLYFIFVIAMVIGFGGF